MFESLLNSILEKTLGQYIEGLKKADLEVSVWSGDVELNNVQIKKDIFQKFGLPFELIYGRIGRLKISVPWKNIGSKPVDVQVENVIIVVKPITDQSKWKSSETNDAEEYNKKRDLINKFAHKLYSDLIKTKEELAKEAGILDATITKIIDNLQVALRNIHLRIENEDFNDQNATFSIGVTLESADLFTTDKNLKKTYIDRSQPQNADLPIYKLLNLKNFGIYYKIRETMFVQHQEKDEDRRKVMQKIGERFDSSGKYPDYADAYLLDPIQLEVQLTQYQPQQALEKLQSLVTVDIKLKSVGICLKKSQYDNLQSLLALTNSFMRFLNTAGLQQTKIYWHQLIEELTKKEKVGHELVGKKDVNVIVKKNVKDLFLQIFQTQIEILASVGIDDGKAAQRLKELNADLERQNLSVAYERIMLAMDIDDIEIWTREVCTKKAEEDIQERAIYARQNSGKGFLSSLFSSNKKPEERETVSCSTLPTILNKAALIQKQLQKNIAETIKAKLDQMTTQDRIKNAIPKIKVNFNLEMFHVSLKDEKGFGIQWYSHGFKVEFKMFDSSNKYNPKTMEVHVINQEFGIKSIGGKEDNPFIQQLSQVTDQPACDIILKLGNQNHHNSDLPQEFIDQTDLDLTVKVLSIEIIYQATPIARLQKFFKVKKLDERTKIQAADQFNKLQSQVNSLSKSIENDFRNNKINIEVAAPTLVIPFKQETLEEVNKSECWVYTMGDVSFKDTIRANIDNGYYECFELKVQKVRFEYAHNYYKWKQQQFEADKILNEISASALIIRKREIDEMGTLESKKHLKQLRSSPVFEIIAGFDTELILNLKPMIFQKLTGIGALFVVEEHPDEYWLKKKQKRLDDSSFKSDVKKQNNLYKWDHGMACLISPRWLIFFDDANVTSHYYFDLNGCNVQDGCLLEGQEVTLKNKKNEICKLQCPSIQIATEWCETLIKAAKEIENLQKNVDIVVKYDFEKVDFDFDLKPRTKIASFNEANKSALDSSDDSTNEECISFPGVEFALKFTAPSLQLNLVTETINRSANVRQQRQAVLWELGTRVEQLTVNFEQYKYHMEIKAKVSSLRVTDNCGDTRFPVIFENQAVEHQNELLTVKVSKIQKESPHFFDCDTEVSIGIGGLKIFWKPSSLMLLFRFLRKPTQEQTAKENIVVAILVDKTKDRFLSNLRDCDDNLKKEEIVTVKYLSSNLESSNDTTQQAALIKKQATLANKEPEKIEKKIKNCQQKPEAQVKVDLQLAFLQFICIHPQNTSYPIFSVDLQNLCLQYAKKCDCDQIKLTVTNLQVIDNTNYPETLDPILKYEANKPLIQREILGVNSVDYKKPEMLDLQITIFTYAETGSCPLQASKDFNMNVSVNLKQLKILVMLEQLMRMIDYINHQIVLVISPDNIDEEKVKVEYLKEKKITLPNAINYLFWYKFDLKQQYQGPSLDIKIESPLVIIPDLRSNGTQQFDLDFGKITVVSKIEVDQGYWLFLPEKEIFTSTYLVNTSNIRFEFNQLGQHQQIFNNERLEISVKMLNYSPFFDEDEPVYTQIPQAPVFDLGQINSSIGIDIHLGMMKVNLPQNLMNEIFDLLNNNILMKDNFQVHFDEQLCSKADKAPQKLKKQVSKQDRKVLKLSVTASVLSLDLRDEQNALISEICIAGLHLGMETYLSGNESIQFSAGSLFIFFDENIESNQKEMLLGHINTPQLVITDKAFYQDLPVTLLQAGKPKFKFTMDTSSNGDLVIALEILQLKLWLRPKVFIELSRYLKQALGRLSNETENVELQKLQVKKASSAVMKLQIHMDESLIIVQHDLISERCIVIQTSMDVLMKSKDPESIKQSGVNINNVAFNTITIDVKNIAGYLCDFKELSEVCFKEASKRDFFQPSSCKIDMESTIDTDDNFSLYTEDIMTIVMNEADLKISIDDLQVLQSIVDVVLGEILLLSSVWAKDKSKSKLLEIEEEKSKKPNLSTMAVHLGKANILIINESRDFYVPLFMLRCDKIGYQSTPMNFKEHQQKGKISVEVNLSYYNSDAGFFEPAIDRFGINVDIESVGKSSKTKLQLADPININFTIGLTDCVTQFNKVYQVAQEKALSFKQKVEDLKKSMQSSKFVDIGGNSLQKSQSLRQPGTMGQNGMGRVLSFKQERQKFSSLYAVRNMTDKSIKIVQVDRAGNEISQDSQIVLPDEIAKLVITKGTINQDGSQSDQFISIKFREGMAPLKRINLNQNNYFTKHSVHGKLDLSREFYVVTSKMEDNRKVLTVRTQYVLTNQTKTPYHIKIFSIDKKTDKIVDIKTAMLNPGHSTPLQDFETFEQHASVRIAIRPKKHKKWGTEYKFLPMKKHMNIEENTEWPHLPSYTIVRKVTNPLDGVFDFVLLPPMIIKNCLPCRINMQIEEEFRDKIDAKPKEAEGVKPNSQIIILDKEEEKHIYDIISKTFTKNLLLKLDLGNQFKPTILTINLLQSKDSTFPVKITDTQNRNFNLACKVETKEAGLKLIFYCENMLICHTQQRLSFFYQKKQGVFDKDNSHELPSPIVESAESESMVYIFDDNQTMFCSLADNATSGFSDKLQIKTIGHVGDFSVTPKDSMKQYNFGYSVHMWLSGKLSFLISIAKHSDIPMTKIVEISPQFIILNKTDKTLLYQQDYEEDNNCHKLAPGNRICYNWEDKSKPQLFTFKPENNKIMSALLSRSISVVADGTFKTVDADYTMCSPFNLKDCGTIYTCCVSQGSEKTYYKVSKRQVDQSIFAVIEKSEPPYLVVNNLKEIDLRICQNDVQGLDLYDNVKSQCQAPFAWQDVNAANKLLEVEFRFQNKPLIPVNDSKIRKKGQEIRSKKISIDGINQTAKIELIHPVTKVTKISVIVSVYKGAKSKVIEFSNQVSSMIIEADEKINTTTVEESKEEAEEELDDFEKALRQQQKIRPKLEGQDRTTINVDINQLTVSLIMNSNEYMNIVLRTLRFQKINTESDVIYYCNLDRIQIDNTYGSDPIFPVVIRPKCVAGDLEHNHTTMHNVNQVFEFYAHQKLNIPNITFFSTIEFLLRELEIKIEFDYAMKLIKYIKVVQSKMAVYFYNQHQIFKPKEKQEEFQDYYEKNRALKAKEDQLLYSSNWKEKTIQAVDELVTYIQRFVGSSMCFEISLFKQTGSQEQNQEKEKGSFGLTMAASGLKLTNLNGAPIQLQALEINDVYGHNNDIKSQFQAHYLSNMKYNLLRIAGSSDLIGNPYNFMNNLGSGMKKYYRDPREQIMQGPQAAVMAGISLVGSTAGMAAHSAASVSGYLGRITGSVNRGIVAASFDRQYIHNKEIRDIQEKPTNTLDGFGKGVIGLGTSVLSGVTGLVTKPIEGARQGGMGFMKGIGMGVAGLFTKPVSGIVDLVSKTTQGIESGVTGNAECKQNNVRVRKPRAFYLALSIVKEYNEVDSETYNHLRRNISKKNAFWACYICGDGVIQGQTVRGPTNEIMMLTSDCLYSLSSEMKVFWQCPVLEIKDISLDTKQGLIIMGKQDKKGNRFQFPESGTQLVECMTIIDDIKYAASVEELVWILV